MANLTPFDYVRCLKAAEFHWFFVQGEDAIAANYFVPGVMSLLGGIEASLRRTIHKLDKKSWNDAMGATLSNSLLMQCKARGLPIDCLAFPGEVDFATKIKARSPHVEVVRVRHNLAHGNISDYVKATLGAFTPECLRDLAATITGVSQTWAKELGAFRAANGIM